MASTEDNRRKFIKSLMELFETFNLDGVDLDWEYPEAGTYFLQLCMSKLTYDCYLLFR